MGTYTQIVSVDVPSSAKPGDRVDIKVTVKNLHSAGIYVTLTGKINGTLLYFGGDYHTIGAGQSKVFNDAVTMPTWSVKLDVWSWYWGVTGEWVQDDHAEATIPVEAEELETLEIDITPVGMGYVKTTPDPVGGYQIWEHNSTGQFPYGTQVQVTAYPHAGYTFDHWSDEIAGGVSYQNPEYVKVMTEHRAVKAHFREDVAPQVETLEIDIEPAGTGHVTTVPASEEGRTTWNDGDTGTFPHGTIVKVTAVPGTGYIFNKFTDEIVGGTSTLNPSYVQPMTEHRAVKAHFITEEAVLETLEIDITPVEAGYVTTTPNPEEGYQQWGDDSTGHFPYGTLVEVMAHPIPGYVFEKWTDEIVGGTSYQNPANVLLMTEHRAVKCHFLPQEEVLETLEIDIEPAGTGHVLTDPASFEGKTEWHNNETGKFPYGTNVQVTAVPESGYAFKKWTDEIVGGVSFQNPEMVQVMDEHRAVKCHFQDEEDPSPGVTLIQDYTYPLASTYKGDVEEVTFGFSLLPEQAPGSDWFQEQVINAFTTEVEKEGASMIKLQVYEDTTPALTTDYKIIATATASPLPWALIIVGVLAILFLIALSYTIIQIRSFLWGEDNGLPIDLGSIISMVVLVMVITMMAGLILPKRGEAKKELT